MINAGKKTPEDFNTCLPTGAATLQMTAILEAGRISLDSQGKTIHINWNGDQIKGLSTRNLNGGASPEKAAPKKK